MTTETSKRRPFNARQFAALQLTCAAQARTQGDRERCRRLIDLARGWRTRYEYPTLLPRDLVS